MLKNKILSISEDSNTTSKDSISGDQDFNDKDLIGIKKNEDSEPSEYNQAGLDRRNFLKNLGVTSVALFSGVKPSLSHALIPFGFIRAQNSQVYADDVFSTYVYKGNGAGNNNAGTLQTITNGIDLAGKGGLVWIKNRSRATDSHLYDTSRGALNGIFSNSNTANSNYTSTLTSFTNSGFTLGNDGSNCVNLNNDSYVSWTFRRAAKFFDVVTWAGDGNDGRQISHSLGSEPGMIIIKRTDLAGDWAVYHKNLNASINGATGSLYFNTSAPLLDWNAWWGPPSSSMFRVRNGNVNVNYIGGSYVAYVFAHETSVNGLIQCGIYTGNGSTGGPSVNLGWEPQFILIKNTKSTGSWQIIDNLRGLVNGSNDSVLLADSNAIESSADYVLPTTTGFQIVSTSSEVNTSAGTYIYLAVRRPNKPPTNGSQVFSSETLGSSGITNAGFPVDLSISHFRNSSGYGSFVGMRVTNRVLMANTTASEVDSSSYLKFDSNKGVNNAGLIGPNTLWWQFKRAPKFFDIICYQGNNINGQTFMHNLGVTPQLIITKARTTDTDNGAGGANKWNVRYGSSVNAPLFLNESSAPAGQQGYIDTMTSTSYRTGTISQGVSYLNTSGVNYVALLFATLAQVSKVGSYVGNGSSQTINCGFITGARFILIKRYDSIGDWYIWDSSRGINALTDPYLILNSMNAEVTTDDSVDPENSGFIVKQNTTTNINVLSASYFFFAIA